MYFAVVFGIRHSNKNKNNFLLMLNRRMKIAGYSDPFYNKEYKKDGRLPPDFVVYGNPKKAKAVFVSSFDTCSKILLPNYLYYPLNEEKNSRIERLNAIVELVLVALCAGACVLLLLIIGIDFSFKSIATFYSIAPVLVSGFIIFKITQGLPNPTNYNRNSAALIVMYSIALELSKKSQAAFVFCNKSCSSPEGFMRFSLKCSEEIKRKIVLLNCIGSGSQLVLAYKEGGHDRAESILRCNNGLEIDNSAMVEKEKENSIFTAFPESLVFFCADKINEEYAVLNTRTNKDRELNTDRLIQIKSLLLRWCSNL